MKFREEYAFISNGRVKDIAVFAQGGYVEANEFARKSLDDPNAIAVDVTYTPVKIGDDYVDGDFYRNGEIIKTYNSAETEIDILKSENKRLSEAIDELILYLTPTEG